MLNNFQYVAKFNNGKYFTGGFSSNSETEELKYANQYSFDWQPQKDTYLNLYAENKGLSYELVKVKTIYEIVE